MAQLAACVARLHADAQEHHVRGERVLVLLTYSGRDTRGKLEVERIDATSLFYVREGRATRLALYIGRDRAFTHLGRPTQGNDPISSRPTRH